MRYERFFWIYDMVKTIVLTALFAVLWILPATAFQKENGLTELDKVITIKDTYVKKKYAMITSLQTTEEIAVHSNDNQKLYTTYLNLFNEYRSFKYDSAYFYLDRAKQIALKLQDSLLVHEVKIKEGFVLMSSGLFKESLDTLNSISVSGLSFTERYEYYSVKARAYYELADYTEDNRFSMHYNYSGNAILDSALQYTQPNTQEYYSTVGLKYLKQHDWKSAEVAFSNWLAAYDLDPEAYAIATSSLAYAYSNLSQPEKEVSYLAKAAIADIQNAIKETVALRNLAGVLYAKGDLKRANRYINLAMEDATFYNAKHRKIAISSILPIIEKNQLIRIEKQKNRLTVVVVFLAILAVAVAVFLVIIFRQLKERNASRKILAESNEKLLELNSNLKEADTIKQEYITYFLKVSSDFIRKIDHIQKSTLQKIITKRQEEVIKSLKKLSVKSERKLLFDQFDEVFLKLFPNFKEEYFKLFPETEETLAKSDDTLNTELRIFALYRLGVQDSHQVAEFLDLSVATIYSYKARIKSRSYYKKDFEDRIMAIKQL